MSQEENKNSENKTKPIPKIILFPDPPNDDSREKLLNSINKIKILDIIKNLPKKPDMDYDEFKETLKKKTEGLSEIEKSFLVYNWITDNISYDTNCLISKKFIPNSPFETFKNRKSTSIGYSRLYRDLCSILQLESVCIKGYSKGNNFEEDIFNKENEEEKKKEEIKKEEIKKEEEKEEEEKEEENKKEEEEEEEKKPQINHEYNVVKIDKDWKFIDTTLGAGYINKRMKFVKLYNDFYFCTNPSDFIYSHFPIEEKWQLLKEPIHLKEFEKGVRIYEQFYKCGFINTNLNDYKYDVQNPNETVVLEYDIEKYHPDLKYNFYFNGNRKYCDSKFKYRENLIELELSFKDYGIYKLEILGRNKTEESYKIIIVYIFEYKEKPKIEKNNINSTAPYYRKQNDGKATKDIKKNTNVNFKIKHTKSKEITKRDTTIKGKNGIFEGSINVKKNTIDINRKIGNT